ncbi:diguanylate cyclase domain-containing protein, partial [Rhizobium brockwellii]|uniref:diguanylate cyclase domain-containing protein n=1 Tax=Rhizobium brockwellii TaxID=3019932 RepID=UPI003F9E2EDE
VAIAQRLNAQFGGKGIVARLGGDEFAVLCHLSQYEVVEQIGATILHLVQQPVPFSGHILHTTTSIGVAIAPDDGQDAD